MTIPVTHIALRLATVVNVEQAAKKMAEELAKSFDLCPKDDEDGNELADRAEVEKVLQSLLTDVFSED